jgi:hypothetical protein
VKKRYTGLNDKRHYCGKLAPNLFFVFEVLATLEIAYAFLAVLDYMGVDSSNAVLMLLVLVAVVFAIGKFWDDRRWVLNRQKGHCKDSD